MQVDPFILAFSALTVLATLWMGFRSAKQSRTASDFFVAGRSVSVGWNASAISGEYLSAASFMGIAGMVMSSGYDALWYPVCYACGYLFLLLFIAGPLRRFGAYTIPDFAEGRFDSPLFRKIAVVFVLFIGFFYTMPQMKGAGTTLAYIFPGLPYWAGVVLVGSIITLNVALGGMKGITLVQAFQYWIKMFAISVPIFVLMAVYGHYGRQVSFNGLPEKDSPLPPGVAFPPATPAEDEAMTTIAGSTDVPGAQAWPWPQRVLYRVRHAFRRESVSLLNTNMNFGETIGQYAAWSHLKVAYPQKLGRFPLGYNPRPVAMSVRAHLAAMEQLFEEKGLKLFNEGDRWLFVLPANEVARRLPACRAILGIRRTLPGKAPADDAWLFPFGPLTTKAAKNAAAAQELSPSASGRPDGDALALRADLPPGQHLTLALDDPTPAQLLAVYSDLTGRQLAPRTNSMTERLDDALKGRLSKWNLVARKPAADAGVRLHNDGPLTAQEAKASIEAVFRTNGLTLVADGPAGFRVEQAGRTDSLSPSPGAAAARTPGEAWLSRYEKPLALLYTYSLIIAIVCGTAGLPHILVRFYTNPDGVAAKRTTMWVMILIGTFYVFPPVFGAMGRNLLPALYAGVGAKGTDKVVLELPKVLNAPGSKANDPIPAQPAAKPVPWGSILSGITCAGAFAAFMSTFSGLLVSMTGALAHDVYGRMLKPQATPAERMRMFRIAAIVLGGVAILAGTFVEPFQINFMVGQAFAIAAASYFPLLFMAIWWRGLTMKGAAAGMLTGGLLALTGISLTSFSDLKWIDLSAFWAAHPLARILCEQPAIWAVPLAILLMVVVSKLTAGEVPSDIRMKMLVLHAPEDLGLKQEYIQEHHGH